MILNEETLVFVTFILFGFLIAGLIFLINAFIKETSRNKIKNLLFSPLSLNTIKNKYKYIFTDFTFDVSMILVFIMSILTENMLR